jgi:ubiquitin-protein ligase
MYKTRINKEALEAQKFKEKTFLLTFQDDMLQWTAYLFGPEDSPYSEGIFEVKI